MWSLLRTNFFHTCSQLKIHSGKSLVLKKKPKRKSLNRLSLEAAVKKKFSKSKAKFVERKPSDYCEEIWLDNLNIQTLKLYRKTSFGEF